MKKVVKVAWIIVRTKDFDVLRFFENQRKKPTKTDFDPETGEWIVYFKVKSRTNLKVKAISYFINDKVRKLEKVK